MGWFVVIFLVIVIVIVVNIILISCLNRYVAYQIKSLCLIVMMG